VPPQQILDAIGQSVTKPNQPEISAKLAELEDLIDETQKGKVLIVIIDGPGKQFRYVPCKP